MKESLKVGVSGVRGIVGQSLTPPIACAFAARYCGELRPAIESVSICF